MKKVFVFAVCGTNEHIDTLHYSLEKLKKFSNASIWIVTDASRNEKAILHDTIIEIQTPKEFNNHQASIFLKTGLHKFLPKGNVYCYLDSDVVAVSSDCDKIFDEYIPPIRFAPDHCQMPLFSPSAVNCNCTEDISRLNDQLNNALDLEDPFRKSNDEYIIEKRKELEKLFWIHKQNFTVSMKTALKYFTSIREFHLSDQLVYNKKTKIWSDKNGIQFMKTSNMRKVCKKLGLKWSWMNPIPRLKDGRSIWRLECDHLPKYIHEKFGIEVRDRNWQHWNGGVFLFNDESHTFLDTWHQKTLSIFKDKKWKTRDQGTLIATVWKLGLANHPTLNKKWNLLADYNNPSVQWQEGWKIQLSDTEVVKPNFVHVYHHFFDTNWLLWRKIDEL